MTEKKQFDPKAKKDFSEKESTPYDLDQQTDGAFVEKEALPPQKEQSRLLRRTKIR